jgi:hypothetical protein
MEVSEENGKELRQISLRFRREIGCGGGEAFRVLLVGAGDERFRDWREAAFGLSDGEAGPEEGSGRLGICGMAKASPKFPENPFKQGGTLREPMR